MKLASASRVSDLLMKADPRFKDDPQLSLVRQRLSDALSDFEFSMFRFNLIPNGQDSVALRMETRGRGKNGQEVAGLVVNYNNFQAAANVALFGQSLFGKDADRNIKDFFNAVEDERIPEATP